MSKPSAPAAPDPNALAQAQSGVNKETAIAQADLNRINQVTPYGTLNYTSVRPQIETITGEDGVTRYRVGNKTAGDMANAQQLVDQAIPQYTATTNLSPEQQTLYNLQTQGQTALGNLGVGQLGRIQNAVAQPFSYNGMTSGVSTIDPNSAGRLQYGVQGSDMSGLGAVQVGAQNNIVNRFNLDNINGYAVPRMDSTAEGGDIQRSLDRSGLPSIQTGTGQGAIQNSVGGYGDIQGGLDFSNLPALMSTADMNQAVQTSLDARLGRLQPTYDLDRQRLETQLANQGINVGSQAYNDSFTPLNQQINDARNAALTSAYGDTASLFGISSQGRNQLANELLTQGNFSNAAQSQAYAQALQNAGLFNAAQSQDFSQDQQNLAANNAARGQLYGEELGSGQFANAAQGQAYGQDLTSAQLANAVQNQAFTQKLGMADLANAAQNQWFNQNLQNAGFNNQAQGQAFNELQNAAAFQNTSRGREIQEASYLRNYPLAEMSAFMSGTAPQLPQFVNSPISQIAPSDLIGANALGYNGALSQYQTGMSNSNATMGAIGGIASAAAAAAIMSDRRLKRDVRKVATRHDGLNVYAYNYIWGEPAVGVMADEAEKIYPHAVMSRDGFKMVDYGRLHA